MKFSSKKIVNVTQEMNIKLQKAFLSLKLFFKSSNIEIKLKNYLIRGECFNSVIGKLLILEKEKNKYKHHQVNIGILRCEITDDKMKESTIKVES